MIRIVFVCLLAFFVIACDSAAPTTQSEPVTNTSDQSDKVKETVASHDAPRTPDPKAVPPVNSNTEPMAKPTRSKERKKFSRSGRPIDTKKFDDAIASAKKASDAKPADVDLKKTLGAKYFERGVALTAAQQYASAMGDFRKASKLDPGNKEVEQYLKMISSIYNSMNIEGPKPGKEPEPIRIGDKTQ